MRYHSFQYRYRWRTGALRHDYVAWAIQARHLAAVPYFRPPCDVAETSTEYLVTVELPGIEDDAFGISLYDDALVVEGHRAPARVTADELRFHLLEIARGPFKLEIAVPAGRIERDRVKATYERGLLRIILPKIGSEAR
jgi:HSP20 family protein